MPVPSVSQRYISVTLLLEALGTGKDRFVVSPVEGKVKQIFSVLDTAVDGDNVLTFAIGGTAITGGTVTHAASGSAAGEVKSCVPSAANTVLKGQALKATTDGGGAAGQARITFLIEQTF
jgi:hypothetical protein